MLSTTNLAGRTLRDLILRRETELTQLAVARMLVARSAQNREHQPMLSLLLAREALNHLTDDETRSELYAALLGSSQRKCIHLKNRRPQSTYFQLSPDGRTLVSFHDTKPVLLDLDGRQLAEFNVKSASVKSASFSPGGEALALIPSTSHEERSVAGWLFDTRGEIAPRVFATIEVLGCL